MGRPSNLILGNSFPGRRADRDMWKFQAKEQLEKGRSPGAGAEILTLRGSVEVRKVGVLI